MMRAALIASLAAALAFPAAAGQAVTLRGQALASGPVTLGDLFDGAGAAGKIIVGPAPSATGAVVLDAAQVQRTAMRAGLSWANETGLRRVIVRAGATSAAGVAGNVEVLTWNRSLATGEIVQAEDMTWTKLAAAPAGAARDADELIGKTVKRPLRSGSAALPRDVSAPMVIKKDDVVEVTYLNGGVSLSLQGKAIGPAAVGESVGVLNLSSKKIIQAVAAGPGKALVGPGSERLKAQAASSSYLAYR